MTFAPTFASGMSSVAPSPLLTDLISYWPLYEASGQRNDVHGTNHLTDNNTVGQGAGIISNAALFVAANSESLSIPDNASLSVGNIDFAISAWFNLTVATGLRGIVTKQHGGSLEYRLYTNENIYGFISGQGGTEVNTGAIVTTGVWHFVIAWVDTADNTLNIQIDNGTIASIDRAGDFPVTSTATFRIGARGNAGFDFLDGLICEVGFWKRKHTAGERTQLWNVGAGLAYPFS